jgi:hypothetical protein
MKNTCEVGGTMTVKSVAGWICLAATAMLTLGVASAVAAELRDFHGSFVGAAIASAESLEGQDSELSIRNLDMSIGPAGRDGFWIDWQTLMRSEDASGMPKYRRKSSRLEFSQVRPGVYRGPSGLGDSDSEYTSWASLSNGTLTVYELARQVDGSFSLATYRRTLTDIGLALEFTYLRNGERIRRVEAEMRRVSGG